MEISGLAGLYCYFLLLCHDWMEEMGLAIWLIPSEFMDVNYGVTLRRYLTERVTLLHIHRFCPTDVQFTDALVSSAVVVFRKSPPPGHRARFSFGGPIEQPQTEALVPLDALRRSRKWTQFPARTSVETNGAVRSAISFHQARTCDRLQQSLSCVRRGKGVAHSAAIPEADTARSSLFDGRHY